MKYESLTIENFRGIEHLEITGLKKANLLVGRNQCGKTSILEAIFLLSGMSNPRLPLTIHQLRNLVLTDDEEFSYLFRNLDLANSVLIEGILDDKKRSLCILPRYADYKQQLSDKSKQTTSIDSPEPYATSTSPQRTIDGVRFEFKDIPGNNFEGFLSLKQNEASIAHNYRELLRCTYLNHTNILFPLDKQMEILTIRKQMKVIVDVLKTIEPRLQDIRMGASGMIYFDLGLDRLVPTNTMGDGIRRIMAILASMYDTKDGVLLVDEIDTGLHYASLSATWKAIFTASEEFNVQIIATTHSYECIEAFSKTHDETEPQEDSIRLFRIGREGNAHQSFPFDAEVLRAGIEKEFEVR